MTRGRRASCGERGAVTAETALVMPVLIALTLAMVWFISVGVTQMRVTDAAREAARSLARGDPSGTAEELALRVVPGGSVQVLDGPDGQVRVRVRYALDPPGGLLDALPGRTAAATAVAIREEP